jgi:hypothetical protein
LHRYRISEVYRGSKDVERRDERGRESRDYPNTPASLLVLRLFQQSRTRIASGRFCVSFLVLHGVRRECKFKLEKYFSILNLWPRFGVVLLGTSFGDTYTRDWLSLSNGAVHKQNNGPVTSFITSTC